MESRSSSDMRSQSRPRSAHARRNCASPMRSRSSRPAFASCSGTSRAARLRSGGNPRTSEMNRSSLNSKLLMFAMIWRRKAAPTSNGDTTLPQFREGEQSDKLQNSDFGRKIDKSERLESSTGCLRRAGVYVQESKVPGLACGLLGHSGAAASEGTERQRENPIDC